jgi:hypothetical protein
MLSNSLVGHWYVIDLLLPHFHCKGQWYVIDLPWLFKSVCQGCKNQVEAPGYKIIILIIGTMYTRNFFSEVLITW